MCAVTPMKRFVKKSVRGIHTTFTSSKNVQYRLSVKDIRVREGITTLIATLKTRKYCYSNIR